MKNVSRQQQKNKTLTDLGNSFRFGLASPREKPRVCRIALAADLTLASQARAASPVCKIYEYLPLCMIFARG